MKRKKLVYKKVRPMYTGMIVTAERYSEQEAINDAGLVVPEMTGTVKSLQRVVSVGEASRGVKEGDMVQLSFRKYAEPVYSKNSAKSSMDEYYQQKVAYHIPYITIDGKEYMFLDVGDVECIIEEYEEVEVKAKVNDIYVPPKKGKLIKPA